VARDLARRVRDAVSLVLTQLLSTQLFVPASAVWQRDKTSIAELTEISDVSRLAIAGALSVRSISTDPMEATVGTGHTGLAIEALVAKAVHEIARPARLDGAGRITSVARV
jgi:hypothetical protein